MSKALYIFSLCITYLIYIVSAQSNLDENRQSTKAPIAALIASSVSVGVVSLLVIFGCFVFACLQNCYPWCKRHKL